MPEEFDPNKIHPAIQIFLRAKELAQEEERAKATLQQRSKEADNLQKWREAESKRREDEAKQRFDQLKKQAEATEKFHAAQNRLNTLRTINEAQRIYGQTGVAPTGFDISPVPISNETPQFREDLRQGNFGNMYEMGGTIPGYSAEEAPIPVRLQTPETIGRNKLAIAGPMLEAQTSAKSKIAGEQERARFANNAAIEEMRNTFRLGQIDAKGAWDEKIARLRKSVGGDVKDAEIEPLFGQLNNGTITLESLSRIVPQKSRLRIINAAKENGVTVLRDDQIKRIRGLSIVAQVFKKYTALKEAFDNNEMVKAYNLSNEADALLGNMARIIGGEKGVLTQRDIERASGAKPGFIAGKVEAEANNRRMADLKSYYSGEVKAIIGAVSPEQKKAIADTFGLIPDDAADPRLEELLRTAPKKTKAGRTLDLEESRKHGRPVYSGGQ